MNSIRCIQHRIKSNNQLQVKRLHNKWWWNFNHGSIKPCMRCLVSLHLTKFYLWHCYLPAISYHNRPNHNSFRRYVHSVLWIMPLKVMQETNLLERNHWPQLATSHPWSVYHEKNGSEYGLQHTYHKHIHCNTLTRINVICQDVFIYVVYHVVITGYYLIRSCCPHPEHQLWTGVMFSQYHCISIPSYPSQK